MRLPAVAAVVLATVAPALRAQGPADSVLAQAKTLYERLEVERALPLLRELLSSARALEVTRAQRVEALKYLGAAHAVMGQRDSAVSQFRAALDWDPFTDLEPTRFTPGQIAIFAEARRQTFALGVRLVVAMRLDPRSEVLPFSIVTTHRARLRAELARLGDSAGVVLWDDASEGFRELRWGGVYLAGRLAPPGRYRLSVIGHSTLLDRGDSATVYFDLARDGPALEDTLPDLDSLDLLPEMATPAVRRGDLLRSLAAAAGVLIIAGGLADNRLGGGDTEASIVAGAAVLTGVTAFVLRRDGRITRNVQANREREEQRRAANEAIRTRNLERIARTALVVAPAVGAER